jgi:hypothetical protein
MGVGDERAYVHATGDSRSGSLFDFLGIEPEDDEIKRFPRPLYRLEHRCQTVVWLDNQLHPAPSFVVSSRGHLSRLSVRLLTPEQAYPTVQQ